MFQVVSDRNRANRAHSHRLPQRLMAAACITATVWIVHCTASYANDASSSGTLAPVPRNLPKDQDAAMRRAQVRSVLAARLKAARASGDTENIQRYQRLLTDLDGKASSHHGDQ